MLTEIVFVRLYVFYLAVMLDYVEVLVDILNIYSASW